MECCHETLCGCRSFSDAWPVTRRVRERAATTAFPATALCRATENRSGGKGNPRVTIENASVVEQKLSRTPGFKGLFTNDQSERFDATLAVTFRLYREGTALSVAEGSVNVRRSRTVAENASVAEREQIFYDMTKQLMQAFNTEAEARLRQYFSPYLR